VSSPAARVLPLAAAQAGSALVRELVVISGKGGTGKTSVVASFAVLAGDAVLADCDVDAADLHLVVEPEILERHLFAAGHRAAVRAADCAACGECLEWCRFDALTSPVGSGVPEVDPIACEGCGVCAHLCPVQAIDLEPRVCGEWFVSATRCGPMVHARLGIAAENSGKLVSVVRSAARRAAARSGCGLVLIDGPPGIGCPVIAAVTGATAVLLVTEPSVSGAHDVARALALARHFGLPVAVAVNRWDLCPEGAERIEAQARANGAEIAGRIRYDPTVTRAQLAARSTVELGGPAAEDIRVLWERVAGLWLRGLSAASAGS
jgi:MinD superfamily P-loop ATPase